MRAVPKTASRGEVVDLRERLLQAFFEIQDLQLPHPGRVEKQRAALDRKELATRRGVPPLPVPCPDLAGLRDLHAGEQVYERRLPGAGRSEEGDRLPWGQAVPQRRHRGAVCRAHHPDRRPERDGADRLGVLLRVRGEV